jgi:hypothetical protein
MSIESFGWRVVASVVCARAFISTFLVLRRATGGAVAVWGAGAWSSSFCRRAPDRTGLRVSVDEHRTARSPEPASRSRSPSTQIHTDSSLPPSEEDGRSVDIACRPRSNPLCAQRSSRRHDSVVYGDRTGTKMGGSGAARNKAERRRRARPAQKAQNLDKTNNRLILSDSTLWCGPWDRGSAVTGIDRGRSRCALFRGSDGPSSAPRRSFAD